MGLLGKIFTAIRGVANETGEAIVDAQGIRILEQEIRDANKNLNKAKISLTSVMADAIAAKRKQTELETTVQEYEGYVSAALKKNDQTLAMEVAEKLAQLENELAHQRTLSNTFENQANQLKTTVKETEKQIQALEQQINVVKTTEAVQKAAAATADNFSGTTSSLSKAAKSLEKIKARQQKRQDQMTAATQLAQDTDQDDLKKRLQKAGISSDNKQSAQAILDRLKKNNT